jgi:hypothetical protein
VHPCDFWLALLMQLDDPISTAVGSSFEDGAVNIGVDKYRFEPRDILERPISSGRGRPA